MGGVILENVFGKFNWNRPSWIKYLRYQSKARPILFFSTCLMLVLLFTAAGFGLHWYQNLPKPTLVSAEIFAPPITPIADSLKPEYVGLQFGIMEDEFKHQSVAPLDQIGKKVTEHIRISPSIEGEWTWQSDNYLIFYPKEDWPSGVKYTITCDKALFREGVKMKSLSFSFSTAPFKASIAELKFYQDPVQESVKQIVATLDFDFPVNPESLLKHTTLQLQALKNGQLDKNAQKIPFTVRYDAHKRKAFLTSENIELPALSRYVVLTLDKGIESATRSSATLKQVRNQVLIPDKTEIFKVMQTNASIVRNAKDRPEQVLTIETSIGAKEAAINKAVHAYVLPIDYPVAKGEPQKLNYEWTSPFEITPAILAASRPLPLSSLPRDRNYATLHSFIFNESKGRTIYLTIDKGVSGFGGYVLNAEYKALVKIPPLPQEITFLHKGALLALSSEKKLSTLVRGLGAVKFEIARVLPDNVNQLVTQTEGDFNNPIFTHQQFNQYNISQVFSTITHFDTADLAKQQYTTVDFATYLSSDKNIGKPQGLFLLQATGWDALNNQPLDIKANRLILVTDMAMVLKDNQDGSHDVFVQSITEGRPVSGALVQVLGKNGLPILTRTTDADGHVSFPNLKDFVEDKEPVAYLATFNEDVSFIPFKNDGRILNVSRFDVGGLMGGNQAGKSLEAFVFSDRGIYRPADTMHLGFIVKQAYAGAQGSGIPIEVTVIDPRGVSIHTEQHTLDASGLFTFDVPTKTTSLTGQYVINVYTVKDNQPDSLLGSTTVRVNEFQPDTLRIKTSLSKPVTDGWITPQDLEAKVSLWNLYGAPATNRRVTARMVLSPQKIAFEKYKDYLFVDSLFDEKNPPKSYSENLTDTKTNDLGGALIPLNLEKFDKATYQLKVYVEGFEGDSGRSVASESQALVSPLLFLVGAKPDGDLHFIKQKSARSLHLIAVDKTLSLQQLQDVTLELQSLKPVTTLVKKADGTYQYQSIIQSSVKESKSLSIPKEGLMLSLPTETIGDFAYVILDKNRTELQRIPFNVVGESQTPLAKNAELQVTLNKSEYKEGETIELQIVAPYTGSGLITIERDKIYAYKWFKATTTNSVQTIFVPKGFEGNGYVNVSFVRDWNSPDMFISPLSYAIVPFSVDKEKHILDIDLKMPEGVRPGEAFVMHYKTSAPAKMVVFAVDEGILQVTRFKTPNPLAFFFQKHALEVTTQQTVDLILPQFIQSRELSAVGGDGNEEALAQHINPFKRKTESPVVYWSGVVDSDSTERELVYQVPDYFNGTLRVMAVAVSDDALGSIEKKSEIRADYVITPSAPTFVAPNDLFEISVTVANNAHTQETPVTLTLDVPKNLAVEGSPTQTISIPAGQEKVFHYTLRALSLTDTATLHFVASGNGKASTMATTLSVRPASDFSIHLQSGMSNKAEMTVDLTKNLYPEYKKLQAMFSTSPLILVAGLQQYLEHYPYGCTEQLVSQTLPLIAMGNQPWFTKDLKRINEIVMETIRMLRQRQKTDGSFSYWPADNTSQNYPFITAYAMHFLTEAKAQGYSIPADVFSQGKQGLKELVAKEPVDLDTARNNAYAIYLLTRNEIVTTNYLTNLLTHLENNKYNWQEDITGAYVASTYQLLHLEEEANRLIGLYKTPKTQAFVQDFNSPAISDAQYLYLLSLHFPDKLSKVEPLINTLVAAMNSEEMNTVLSGYASLSLGAFDKTRPTIKADNIEVIEIASPNTQKTVSKTQETYQQLDLSLNTTALRFKNPQNASYFYQVVQAGFDKDENPKPIYQGLEVQREYRSLSGDVIDKVTLGSEIEVHIHVRSLNNTTINHIALVDLLPGGFEVVRESVKQDGVQYVDVREDRVVFFTSANPEVSSFVYRIKATNVGVYAIPSVAASSMYNPALRSSGVRGQLQVVRP